MVKPDDHVLLLLAVILEIIQVLIREITGIALVSKPNSVYLYDPELKCSGVPDAEIAEQIMSGAECNSGAAIILLVLFSFTCLIPLLLCVPLTCCYLVPCTKCLEENDYEDEERHSSPLYVCCVNIFCKCCKCTCDGFATNSEASMLIHALQSIALTLYFFGDNLAPILHRYGSCVNCDEDCVQHAIQFAKVALVTSAILLHGFPALAKYVTKLVGWEYEPTDTYQALGIFGIVIKANSIYTTLIIVLQQNAYCSSTEEGLGWTLLVVCTFAASIYMGIKAKLQCCSIVIGILAFPLVFQFLLVDNFQPLDCTFNCDDPQGMNMTLEQKCCNLKDNFSARIGLAITTLLFASILVVVDIIGICCCMNKKNRVLPRS